MPRKPFQQRQRDLEGKTVDSIDQKAMWDKIRPAVEKAIQLGGGAQEVLSQSQAFAAMEMIKLLADDKSDIRFRAAKELLDRTLGKSIERKVSIHGDITTMNERELDAQMQRLFKETNSEGVLDAIIESTAKSTKKKAKLAQKARRNAKSLVPEDIIDV